MVKAKTYSELRQALDEVLSWFDGDDLDVDEAIVKYQQALRLTKELEEYLNTAKNKIQQLTEEA